METRTVVACLAVFLAVSADLVFASPRPIEDDSSSGRQDDGRTLESDIRWLKEKTAELAIVAERVKALLASRTNNFSAIDQVKRARINKRHCWDVADVCCMWNIC